MSTTIDNRAVALGFDNAQFERGVKTSLDTLSNLKKGLDLTESAKSLDKLALAGRSFSLGPIGEGVQAISNRFSSLGIIGMTVLQNLTSAALDLGRKMWTSITGPAKLGFSEYETQMNAIQTIMANTSSKGTTLVQVNEALDQLNEYSDRTIYNFSEMAKNIGTFTAAGVDLETSVASIKGIANLAAVSGSTSQQAATAMYQLSQAISSGTVKLMDWNSVVNAGMGGEVFQNALKDTARVHGIAIDDMIKAEGGFRATLSEGWLSSEILTETLSKFTGDLNAEQLKTIGYTEDQITEILKLGQIANDAATKVKTFSQLQSTLKESTQSGWAQTWRILIGDFEEAKSLFTEINDILSGSIQRSAESRNLMLQQWKDLGGREMLIESLRNAFEAFQLAILPVKDALKEIFPPSFAGNAIALRNITRALRDFTAGLKMGEETSKKVKRIFLGVFAVVDILKMALSGLALVFKGLFSGMSSGSKDRGVLEFLARIGDFLLSVRNAIKAGKTFEVMAEKIVKFILNLKTVVSEMASRIGLDFGSISESLTSFIDAIREFFSLDSSQLEDLNAFVGSISDRFAPLGGIIKIIGIIIGGFAKLVAAAAPIVGEVLPVIKEVVGHLFQALIDAFGSLDFSKPFDILNAGLLTAFVISFKKFVSKGSTALDGVSGMLSGITGILDGVRGCLEAYQKNLQAKTLMTIAGAIAILVASLVVLSMIDSKKLTTSMLAITGLFADLSVSMAVMSKGASLTGGMGLAAPLLAISVAVLMMAGALKVLSTMDQDEIENGILAIGALIAMMGVFIKLVSNSTASFASGASSLLIFAFSLKLIVGVVEKLGGSDIETIRTGLIELGVILAELAAFMLIANQKSFSPKSAVGLIILSLAILSLTNSVTKLGDMDRGALAQGLIAIALIMAEMSAFIALTKEGKGVIQTAVGMLILSSAMVIFADAVKKFSDLSWEEIARGLVGMGGALVVVGLAMHLMPKNMAGSAVGLVLASGAILLLSEALSSMGKLSLKQIGKGLLALGGSIGILAIGLNFMETALPGAFALLVTAGALQILVPVLQSLGSMELKELGMALAALAGFMIIFGLAGLALAPVAPILVLVGAAISLLGIGIMGFAIGLSILAVTGSAAIVVLGGMLTALVAMVPSIVSAFAGALVQFAKLIGAAAPEIAQAFISLVGAWLTAIVELAPQIATAVTALLQMLYDVLIDNTPGMIKVIQTLVLAVLDYIRDITPVIIQTAYDLLIDFLSGIRDNLPEVVATVAEIITAYLEALGTEIPKIIDAGYKMVIALIDGVTKAIRDNGGELDRAIGDLVDAIITGLTDGILGSVKDVINAVVNLGSGIIDALKTLLGIASPSKEMKEIGKQTVKGLAIGLSDRTNTIEKVTENLGDKALSGFRSAVGKIGEAIDSGLDIYPTITPIVDLSSVFASEKDINSVFGDRGLTMFGSVKRLSNTSANMEPVKITEGQQAATNSPSSLVFNQNNYSPKALSPSEIYRNTRNQLLMAKGIVGK